MGSLSYGLKHPVQTIPQAPGLTPVSLSPHVSPETHQDESIGPRHFLSRVGTHYGMQG